MSTKILTAAVLAASITGFAGAGLLTMTANSTTGVDAWAGLSGYKMVLTIDCSTMNDAGSSSSFTLSDWDFKAFSASGEMKFHAEGTNKTFTASGTGPKFLAVINLDDSEIKTNLFAPPVDSISFSYSFTGSESLLAAITASAIPSNGELQLGTTAGTGPTDTGMLYGGYAVPAPGAAALLGLGGLISRRRKA
jgi:hypothetical protein